MCGARLADKPNLLLLRVRTTPPTPDPTRNTMRTNPNAIFPNRSVVNADMVLMYNMILYPASPHKAPNAFGEWAPFTMYAN